MRIVDRKTFVKMDGQVLFAKYEKGDLSDPQIKVGKARTFADDNPQFHDFEYDPLYEVKIRSGSPCTMIDDILNQAEADSSMSFELDFHFTGRDGCFDEDQLFAIFEPEDVKQLIERLQEIIE